MLAENRRLKIDCVFVADGVSPEHNQGLFSMAWCGLSRRNKQRGALFEGLADRWKLKEDVPKYEIQAITRSSHHLIEPVHGVKVALVLNDARPFECLEQLV